MAALSFEKSKHEKHTQENAGGQA